MTTDRNDHDTPTLRTSPDARAGIAPTYRLRISTLAWSFPSLFDADGVHPWEPERFQAALLSGSPAAEALHAGRFVLSVWNPRQAWALGAFDLHEALGCWDEEHREAFGAWVSSPWWP